MSARRMVHLATLMGSVLVIGMFASLSRHADATPKSDIRIPPKRTWPEVKAEINQAFDACQESYDKVKESLRLDLVSIGGRCGGSIQPGTSVLEMVFDRHPSGRPAETVVILDIRIERDFNHELGQASAFRIVPKIARDEGLLMLKEMVSFFEKNKWPYKIIDPKKKEKLDGSGATVDSEKQSRP